MNFCRRYMLSNAQCRIGVLSRHQPKLNKFFFPLLENNLRADPLTDSNQFCLLNFTTKSFLELSYGFQVILSSTSRCHHISVTNYKDVTMVGFEPEFHGRNANAPSTWPFTEQTHTEFRCSFIFTVKAVHSVTSLKLNGQRPRNVSRSFAAVARK